MASCVDVFDFFCGCGGTSAGFKAARLRGASYRLLGGVDIDKHALATYRTNLGAPTFNADVLQLARNPKAVDSLLKSTARDPKNPLVLIGCAPCQGFSSHTKMEEDPDPRNSLLAAFTKIAVRLSPSAILIENVPEMFADRNWPYFKAARTTLEREGYVVKARIYNFATFGLPQERFRAVVMAFRKQFRMPEPMLQVDEFRTVRQAISALPILKASSQDPADPMHVTSKHRQSTIDLLSKVPKDGGNRPPGVGPKCLENARRSFGGYTDVYGRLAWDKPALTITARCRTPSCGRFAHPEQNRGLSVREAALLQGFPKDYFFEGPFDDKFKQVGNAVPPLVAKFLAEHMHDQLVHDNSSGNRENAEKAEITESIGPGFSILINGIKRRRDKDGLQIAHSH